MLWLAWLEGALCRQLLESLCIQAFACSFQPALLAAGCSGFVTPVDTEALVTSQGQGCVWH